MRTASRIGRWLLGAALSALSLAATAQTLDEVTETIQGEDVVAHLRFLGSVRLVQQTTVAPATLVQLQIELLTPDASSLAQRAVESRRVTAMGAAPGFALELNAGQSLRLRDLSLRFEQTTQVRARQGLDAKTIDLVFPGAAPRPQAAKGADQRYAVRLAIAPATAIDKLPALPDALQKYPRAELRSAVAGVSLVEVDIGIFPSLAAAELARKAALESYPAAVVVDRTPRRAARRAAQAAPAAPAAPPASVEVESRTSELMASAKEAMSRGDTDAAIAALNQLLLLPPNSASQDGQELIGLAWEMAGNLDRARIEYELYLKLFPAGPAAQRVEQRLAAISPPPGETQIESAATPTEQPGKRAAPRYSGTISEYYLGGKARTQSLVNLASGIDQSTLSKTTESALVTNVDLGARYATDAADIRAVFRGTGSKNLTTTSNNNSVLNAAYIDYTQRDSGLALRLGRQTPINGGLLGMFDGLSLSYPLRSGVRIDLMGGTPANPLLSVPSERLYAGMIEVDSIVKNLGGDLYIIEQTTQGITNRRAVGGEARYSGERGSVYALLDYDQLFHAVNAVSLQGSLQGAGQTTYTLLLDDRKAPSLELTNALISVGAASLKTLLQTQSLQQVQTEARATSAEARQVLLSASRPIAEKWQATADVRFSEIGALPAVGDFAATPATGAQYGLTLQLTGSNLYSRRDINNFNLSLLTTPFLHGTQLGYNNLTGFDANKFTLEPSLRFYTQRDNQGSSLHRVTPGLRGSYNWSKRLSYIAECFLEHSTNHGPSGESTSNSAYFYFGLRLELF